MAALLGAWPFVVNISLPSNRGSSLDDFRPGDSVLVEATTQTANKATTINTIVDVPIHKERYAYEKAKQASEKIESFQGTSLEKDAGVVQAKTNGNFQSIPAPLANQSRSATRERMQRLRARATKRFQLGCRYHASFDDIKKCQSKLHWLTDDSSCQQSIQSWSDVQRCLNHHDKTITKPLPTRQFVVSLIGERNTGSKFMVEEMKKCFPSQDFPHLQIRRDFIRPKHWFQRVDQPVSPQLFRLIVAAFRDPFEWVAAMMEQPYHAPNHLKGFDESWKPIPLEWEEFVRRPWSLSNRTQEDLDAYAAGDPKCKLGFKYHQVMPCKTPTNSSLPPNVERGFYPIYELKRDAKPPTTGVPYDNILQLRSDKIINFLLEVPLLLNVGGFLAVRYEDMLLNGTRPFLEQVARVLGLPELPARCQPQGPQPHRLGKRKIPEGLREWIRQNMNNKTERLLGYPFEET